MSLFISCAQGFESLLTDELSELGIQVKGPGYCGVYVEDVSMMTIYTINYRSRIASRVLLPLLEFSCRDKTDLYKNTKEYAWEKFFKDGLTFSIDANVRHERFNNSLFATQIMKDAICDRLREKSGNRPSVHVKNPDLQLNLFIDVDRAILSFDTSGQPLYKRNYRLHTGGAPMQETLAASLLRVARYSGDEVMVDPCCGSGTLLIEALAIASNTAPGFWREHWGFFKHPDFRHEDWFLVKKNADLLRRSLKKGHWWGIEREKEIAHFCQMNVANAGFGDLVTIIQGDFIKHPPMAPYNFLITNPPHGLRLASEEALVPLYRALGDFMKQKMAKPARGFVYTSSKKLSKEVGLAAKRRHVIASAGLEARLLEFDIFDRQPR